MHVLCASDATLTDSLKAAIATCDEVYFEINLGDMSDMLNSLKYMRMNDKKTLIRLLKPDEYARVKDYFSQTFVDAALWDAGAVQAHADQRAHRGAGAGL
jgi:uncharacterized protein YbaP (TraB family)